MSVAEQVVEKRKLCTRRKTAVLRPDGADLRLEALDRFDDKKYLFCSTLLRKAALCLEPVIPTGASVPDI